LTLASIVAVFACTSSQLDAQSLAWDPNPESDIAGYKVFQGTASGTYGTPVDVGKTTTYQPQSVDWTRRMYFAVKAYNTAGLESPFSNEAVWTPPSITTLTALSASSSYPLVAGTPVTWTATGSNNLGPVEFRFWVYRRTAWQLAQDWSSSNTWTWTPLTSDQGSPYYVQVWARAVGAAAAYEAWLSTPSFAVMPAPLSLSANVDFPTPPGNQVTWTATLGSPGTGAYEYRFQALNESTSTWTVFRNYSPSNQAQWTPQAAGRYVIQAWARQVGSPAQYDLQASTPSLDVASSPLTVTSLSANAVFPASTGTPITWTVRVQGGTSGPIQYEYWLYSSRNGWRNAQPYGPSETFTWTPVWGDEDDYALQVWVRSNGSTATYDAWAGTPMFQIQRASLHLTTSSLFPVAPGTQVNWMADVPDPSVTMEYQFWVYASATDAWSLEQAYGAQKTFTWVPLTPGNYAVQAWARQVGSTAFYDLYRGTDLLEVSSGPAQMVSLTSNVALPVAAGTTIVWTAGATGGTAPVEYQFWRQDGSNWVMVQDYSSSNTYTWITSSTDVGQHDVQARVRSTGSSAPYESQMTTGVFSIQP
jgi:hypothetical protein